jgi:hypothetical protein
MTSLRLLAWAALAAVTVLVFLLPFIPCWREWRSPTDRAALVVERDEVNSVHYFANAFRDRVSQACAHDNLMLAADPHFHRTPGPADTFPWHSVLQPVIVSGSLHIDDLLVCPKPVYASGNAVLPGGAHLAALLCKGDASFGPDTNISEFAHADGSLSLGPGSIVLQRVTAGAELVLGNGTGFCRMHAPAIHFGANEDRATTPGAEKQCFSPALPGLAIVAWGEERYRGTGDVRLPINHFLNGTLIAGGNVLLERGSAIFGAVKARRNVRLDRGVQIHGALVCEGDIDIGPDCWIKGPVVCEGDVRVGSGSRIGTAQMPTTMAASRVLAETGVTAHGTVWARDAGVVAA